MRYQIWSFLFILMLVATLANGDNQNGDYHQARDKRQAGSCIHPPTSVLKRAACIASCKIQNCATGTCRGRTCVCSRCSSGWQG